MHAPSVGGRRRPWSTHASCMMTKKKQSFAVCSQLDDGQTKDSFSQPPTDARQTEDLSSMWMERRPTFLSSVRLSMSKITLRNSYEIDFSNSNSNWLIQFLSNLNLNSRKRGWRVVVVLRAKPRMARGTADR